MLDYYFFYEVVFVWLAGVLAVLYGVYFGVPWICKFDRAYVWVIVVTGVGLIGWACMLFIRLMLEVMYAINGIG